MFPRCGEIWWVYTPGQPYDPHQPRPALIISDNTRNRRADDVIVVPIFSRGTPGPTRVPLAAGEGGLPHDSVIFCEEVATIHHDFLASGPFDPPVSEDVLEAVVAAILNALW
jgi:mRNA-degrading endonuclease toxin of MazEF toxin-antitoxin module